jgi:pyruvate formate lyase activating enzyme
VYGKLVAEHVDPVEKKPLFHLLPGSLSYSVATAGCNFRCLHCQNADISQVPHDGSLIRGVERSPQSIVNKACAADCRSVAYTYTEPTVFFEYARDIAEGAVVAGLKNVFVTNGYITSEALQSIRPLLHGANIDLKGFSERFYREVVHATLSEVLDSIIEYRRQGIWVELTTLLIPGYNDSDNEIRGMAEFIAGHVGIDTPWHLTAFYPAYRLMHLSATSPERLKTAREIGLNAGLRYVYTGNARCPGGEDTSCPSCGYILVRRSGFSVIENRLQGGRCPECSTQLAGVWS